VNFAVANKEPFSCNFHPPSFAAAAVVEDPDVSSTSSFASRGLPEGLKQQLVIDIQFAGGLDHFSLIEICKTKQDLYGGPKTKLRRKVQNQVDRWKKVQRAEFNKLALLSVAATPKKNKSNHSKKQQKTPDAQRSRNSVTPSSVKTTNDRFLLSPPSSSKPPLLHE
jgi:hypothetical protein